MHCVSWKQKFKFYMILKHYHCEHFLLMDTEFLVALIFWYQICAAGLPKSFHFQ